MGGIYLTFRRRGPTARVACLLAVAALLGVLAAAAMTSAQGASATDLVFTPSTAVGGATHVSWGFRFTASGPLDPSHPITITAQPGALTPSNKPDATFVNMVDLTTGADDGNGANVAQDGASATMVPRNPIKAGDVVALAIIRVNNPAGGTAFRSISLSQNGTTLSPNTGSFTSAAQSVGDLAFSPSTTAGGATGVNWGYRFRLSSTGRLPVDGTVTVMAPAGGTFGSATGYSVKDLTTFSDPASTSGMTLDATHTTATFRTGTGLAPGDVIQLTFRGATNPAAGAQFSTAGVSTSADLVAGHPGSGAFTAAGQVSDVLFSPSSPTAGASATWGFTFRTSATGRLLEGGTMVLGIPAGATLPTTYSSYALRDVTTGLAFGVQKATQSGSQLTLLLSIPGRDVRGGDLVTLEVNGVTNPGSDVTPSQFTLSTGSDPAPVTAGAPPSGPGGSVAGLEVGQTTLAAGATGVVWTAEFGASATGGWAAHAGAVTFTGPAGTFHNPPYTVVLDVTSNASCINCSATVSADGSSVTVHPTFAAGAGDLLVLEAHRASNPAAGPAQASIATGADPSPVQAAPATFTAPQSPASVTVLPSTLAGGAINTAWTVLFSASSSGGLAGDGIQPAEVQLTLPPGTAVELHHTFGVYDLTTGTVEESSGSANTGGNTASFYVGGAVSPGDELALVLPGVTNPAPGTYQPGSMTVSTTSDTQNASPAAALTLVPQRLPSTDLLLGTDSTGSAADRLFAEFTTSDAGELISSDGRMGSVTLSAPAGTTFSNSNCFMTFDLSTGERGCPNAGTITDGGATDSVMPPFVVGGGDVMELTVAVTNPATGLTPPMGGFRLWTSSDDGSPAVSGAPFSGTEGASATGPVATIDGSCPASATIDWGDGTPTSNATVSCQGLIATLSGTHTYAEFGSYPITASASDGSSAASTATIADAPVTGSPVTGLTATAGAPFTGVVARFTDANPSGQAGDFTASIDWGDGTTSAGTLTFGSGKFAVHGAHTYGEPLNPATVVVHIADAGGSTTSAVESLTVNAPGAPAVTLTQPANGATVTTATPAYSGAAGTAPADDAHVTVKVYAGGAVSGSPVQTLSTTAAGGSWSVSASAALSDGTYTAQAEQSTTTGVSGFSSAHVFKIKAPAPPPPPPPPGPGAGGGPPAGCQNQAAFGAIAAVGCLQAVVDVSQIPAAEKRALCAALKLDATACDKRLAKDVKKPATDPLLAQGIVRVNGLDLTPRGTGVVLLDPRAKAAISSNALVQILGDRVTLHAGAITLGKTGDVKALDANLSKLIAAGGPAAEALKLGGFNMTGTLSVKLIRQATQLKASVALPGLFTAIGGGSLTAQATATADNAQDIQFNQLYINGSPMGFGGFQLKDVAFCYQNHISDKFCQARTKADFGAADPSLPSWNVTAKVSVLGATLDAAPPPPTYGIGFVGGSFAFGGAAASFPAPGVALSSGVFLTRLGGSFGVNPVRATGAVGLSVGDVASIDGSLFVVVPQDGQQYAFTGHELGNVIKPPLALPKVTVSSFALAAGGSVGLKIPFLGKVPLADGYLVYAYPSYVAAGGGFNVNLFTGALVVDGGLQGALNFGNGMFDIEGGVSVNVNAGPIQAGFGAQALVSNVGIAGCGTANVFGSSTAAGVGYKWGQGLGGLNVMVGSCDLTPYRVVVSASSAAAARRAGAGAAASGLRVPGGLPNEMLKVIGRGGAPDVTVTGPGGVQASTAGGMTAQRAPFLIKRDPRLNTTYVAILHPPAGNYAITANPESPAIAQVLSAHGFTPVVKGRVTGAGPRRQLHYKVNSQPGEKVTFVERGKGVDKLIGSATRSHGVLRFRPAPGPGGSRQIVAMATEGGVPLILSPGSAAPGQRIVTRYTAPGPLRLVRARGLRARRTGSALLVAWKRVPGAHRYVVLVALRDGLRSDYVVKRTLARIAVPTVGPLGGRVTVHALGDGLTTLSARAVSAKVSVAAPRHRRSGRHRHR